VPTTLTVLIYFGTCAFRERMVTLWHDEARERNGTGARVSICSIIWMVGARDFYLSSER
jgi:hypothetical protein